MAELIVSPCVEKLVEYVFDSAVESVGELAKEKIGPYFGGRAKLRELGQTMRFIQARLHDAERRGEGESGEATLVKEWLKSLKAVLFRLEDLFEEVAFADQENEEELQEKGGNKLPKCFCILFSRSNPFKINKLVADEAKAIMKDLESIKLNMKNLGFRECGSQSQRRPPPLVNRVIDRETGSYVGEETVFGRDDDKKKTVRMLLDSNVDHVGENTNVSVIPIVGIGGLGKTTLAQLVFNDKKVHAHFELKAWACISEVYSSVEYTEKILKSTEPGDYTKMTLEQIQTCLREAVNNKKYLLVLDDVWDEDRERWLRLKGLLSGGKQGSRIIVTSRSRVVAGIMGTVEPYELKGLSDDESWVLFKRLAFKEGQQERMPQLTVIGREIAKKCGNLPLAIKVIAALLYKKDTEQEWRSFKDKDLMKIEKQGGEDRVMSTLKLSYDQLEPHLKQCFAYCSLFPKDYVFDKDDLIYHWMAQGYTESSDGYHASPEDVGHGYFMELLRRSFFQDFKRGEFGLSFRCKMHDLMNHLAGKVAGDGCLFLDEHTNERHVKDTVVWHVSVGDLVRDQSWLFTSKRIRSLLVNGERLRFISEGIINELFFGLRYLRTLDLRMVELESLPDVVGELKHLRYLGLKGTMEYLPQSITRLRNLQTLDLSNCRDPKELPSGFNKLINLRHLILNDHFHSKFDMPPGFGELTALQRLNLFYVGEGNGLDALANMINLSGDLIIRFRNNRANAVSEAKAANLKGKKVTSLSLFWQLIGEAEEDGEEEEERVLEWLQPPPTINYLQVWFWGGRRFPSWGMEEEEEDNLPSHSCSVPNLVYIEIVYCKKCQHLPPFSTLPRLRVLKLEQLDALEYIESGVIGGRRREPHHQGASSSSSCSSSSNNYYYNDKPEAVLPSSSSSYFPTLENLVLTRLPQLKGWSKEYSQLGSFYLPNLVSLDIYRCPKMMSMPPLVAPRLESLKVEDIHGKGLNDLLSAQSPSSRRRPTPLLSLKRLQIRHVNEGLESLSINLPSLEDFEIWSCRALINITAECASHLLELSITDCPKLMSMPLLAPRLESLEVKNIHGKGLKDLLSAPATAVDQEESTSTIATPSPSSRRRPTLSSLKRLEIESVNEGLESLSINLPSLEDFQIWLCLKLTNLMVECPSPLRKLSIRYCPKLISMPPLVAPRLESLKVEEIHGKGLNGLLSAQSPSSRRRPTPLSSLKRLHIQKVHKGLESLSINLPSLEEFTIGYCQELINITMECPSPLRKLIITDCPWLMSMPLAVPRLESLQVSNIHGKALKDLSAQAAAAVEEESTSTSTRTPSHSHSLKTPLSSLKLLQIESVNEGLESLSINLPSLEHFKIWSCKELINITVECPVPLQRLELYYCEKLRDESGALQHLYPVMYVYDCPGLEEDMRRFTPIVNSQQGITTIYQSYFCDMNCTLD